MLVGDWDGNRTDTLAVRRGNTYFVTNALATGRADYSFGYGDPGDAVLVGRWTATQTGDSLAVRRATSSTWSTRPSPGTRMSCSPTATLTPRSPETGDSDGVDGVGVRRT